MKLVTRIFNRQYPFLAIIEDFESTILHDAEEASGKLSNKLVITISYALWKLKFHKIFMLIIKLTSKNEQVFLSIIIGENYLKYFPYCYLEGLKSIYIFDAWPNVQPEIIKYIKDFDISYIFTPSLQMRDQLQLALPNKNCFWIPEAGAPQKHKYQSFNNKTIDVLCLGRKDENYHQKIKNGLAIANRKYVYEKIKGQVIFPEREDFIEALASTKISICIPSNITHPERVGGIETTTARYFESMCSKCLIVGKAPKELIDLFGYNPIIEIDYTNPCQQLDDILTNFDYYIPLIERNYLTVLNNHTWEDRWNDIKEILSNKKTCPIN
jgi:hypothetical protein